MTGYAVEEVMGKSARIVYPDDGEFERVGREKYAEIQQGKNRRRRDAMAHGRTGPSSTCYLSSTAIDPADLSAGVVFTALDITAQKKAARHPARSPRKIWRNRLPTRRGSSTSPTCC